MNRYQFEDLISDYLENNLPISQRKEFEAFLNENPTEKEKVNAIKLTMDSLNKLETVTVSNGFMENLNHNLTIEKNKPEYNAKKRKTYFGFTPIYASIFSGALICFIWVGSQFFPTNNSNSGNIPSGQSPRITLQNPNTLPKQNRPDITNHLAHNKNQDHQTDSTSSKDKELKKPFQLDKRTSFVKDN
jgi:hypothetical protein